MTDNKRDQVTNTTYSSGDSKQKSNRALKAKLIHWLSLISYEYKNVCQCEQIKKKLKLWHNDAL